MNGVFIVGVHTISQPPQSKELVWHARKWNPKKFPKKHSVFGKYSTV